MYFFLFIIFKNVSANQVLSQIHLLLQFNFYMQNDDDNDISS